MATKAEIQAQIDALSAELQGADDDDEVWVEENGRRVQFKGSKATGILNKFKDLWEEPAGDGDGAGDGAGDGDGDGDGAGKDNKPAGGGYFSKRKS
jgi:hypothetical protein